MKLNINQIESRLQAFFEKSINILPWDDILPGLANLLSQAMLDSLYQDKDGKLVAARSYLVYHSQENQEIKIINNEQIDLLTENLVEIASDAGIRFQTNPVIRFETDQKLEGKELFIAHPADETSVEKTSALPVAPLPDETINEIESGNAFLIINSERHFPLNLPVVNIGRRLDNHLVIEDRKISRTHAQIRKIGKQFMLIDLDATGGTFINGQQITKQILNPGDVISLADIPIIFAFENESQSEKTNPTKIVPGENNGKLKGNNK